MHPVRSVAFAALAACALAASSASAVEVQLGLRDEIEYHTNLFGEANHDGDGAKKVDVFRSRIGPKLTVKDPYGRLTYDLDYFGSFDWYVDEHGVNDWENQLRGGAAWAVSPRTTVTVTDSLWDLSSIRFTTQVVGDQIFSLNGGRSPFVRNAFESSIEHYFTRRVVGTLAISNDYVDFAQNDSQADSVSMGVSGSLGYLLSARDRVGVGASFTYQHFDFGSNTRQADSYGRIADAFLSWSRRFEGDWSLSLSGGPGFTQSELEGAVRPGLYVVRRVNGIPVVPLFADCVGALESGCPAMPTAGAVISSNPRARIVLAGGKDDTFTFFGQGALSKRWETLTFAARYSRRQSSAAGDGTASTNDIARLTVDWEPSQLWSAYGDVGWSRRRRVGNQISDYVVADDGAGFAQRVAVVTSSRRRAIDQVTAAVGARRRLTRHLSGSSELRFRRQWNERADAGARTVDFFIFAIRVDYALDPVRF